MTHWKHGYFADNGYTYGYYAETMPSRLYWAALIQGHVAATGRFRYLDAGCGQGVNLVLAAAAHPQCEFVGIDFLPEHIAHARKLADTLGLDNITLIEGDFIELAADASAHPLLTEPFDYAVCHGISTWVAPAVKEALFRLIGHVLRPGGVFYNSYNTFPGWLGMVPFQHLVLLEQRSQTGMLALNSTKAHMEHLAKNAPGLFSTLPALQKRLEGMGTLDTAYLVQEYNNQHWQPVFVSQMMDQLSSVKLDYLGTATLTEAFDGLLPGAIREWLAQQTTTLMKEQLRDYAINQSFRRDLYVKGASRPWPQAHSRLLGECRFVVNPWVARPESDQPFKIKGGSVELNGDSSFYGDMLDAVADKSDGASIAELIGRKADDKYRSSVVQTVSMLLHGGWLMPLSDGGDCGNGKHINRAMATLVTEGAPYRYATLPKTGMACSLSETDWLMVKARNEGLSQEDWPAYILRGLNTLNRALAKDGKPLVDEAEKLKLLQSSIDQFVRQRLPFLIDVGAV